MFNQDFYPTPKRLIHKLIEDINLREINNILEPSAGKGDICDYLSSKNDSGYSNSYRKPIRLNIDCIEIDPNLRHILKGKNYRVVNDDFLSFHTYKNFDLIVANFPFSEGDKHLRKALEMLLTSGGKLRCLVNAETLKNPYSNIRKDILRILENNNASIEYLQDEFTDAERTTNVEVALIKVDIAKREVASLIIDHLEKTKIEEEKEYENTEIVNGDYLKVIIDRYNYEVKAGIQLISEYNKLKAFTRRSFDKEDLSGGESILTLKMSNERSDSNIYKNNLMNNYIKETRYKYWKELFNNKDFTKLFTSNIRRDFYNKLDELKEYDFNSFNINEIKIQMNNQVVTGVRETILSLFDEFSQKHYWDNDCSGNVHFYDGWATNKAWKINKKVIIPLNGFNSWNNRYDPTHYHVMDKLRDVEKVFNYLDTGKAEDLDLLEVMKVAEDNLQSKDIVTKFFKITFYKKGTCHLTFIDEELLKKFNIYAAQERMWLPNSYGKKKYNDMTKEEQVAVKNFEGTNKFKEEYQKVLNDAKYYLYNPNNLVLLS